jgi:hypothetical protein
MGYEVDAFSFQFVVVAVEVVGSYGEENVVACLFSYCVEGYSLVTSPLHEDDGCLA